MLDASRIAEEVRAALLQSALAAYEDAAMRGLCSEGAWEAAVSAMRRVDLHQLTTQLNEPRKVPRGSVTASLSTLPRS
jgi:hypothetical protein